MSHTPSIVKPIDWAVLLFLGLIWGSSFLLIDKSLEGFTPDQLATLRITISMVTLSPLLPFFFKKIKRKNLPFVFLVGLFGSGIPPFMFAIAQTNIDSSLAGILNSTTPLFTFVIGLLFFGTPFRWVRFLGILVGLAGAIFLLLFGQNLSLSNAGFGAIVLVGTICYGTSTNIVKTYLQEVHPIAITSFAFLMIGIPAATYLLSTDFLYKVQNDPVAQSSMGYIAILAIFGTAFASGFFFYLTQRTNALFASTVTYFIPVIAVLLGYFAAEPVSWAHFAGMAMILAGVYLSSRRRKA